MARNPEMTFGLVRLTFGLVMLSVGLVILSALRLCSERDEGAAQVRAGEQDAAQHDHVCSSGCGKGRRQHWLILRRAQLQGGAANQKQPASAPTALMDSKISVKQISDVSTSLLKLAECCLDLLTALAPTKVLSSHLAPTKSQSSNLGPTNLTSLPPLDQSFSHLWRVQTFLPPGASQPLSLLQFGKA